MINYYQNLIQGGARWKLKFVKNNHYYIWWTGKTGKLKEERWQDYNQLMFYGIYFFQKYSKIDTIKISYVYIEHENAENSLILERKYLMNYTYELLESIENVETDSSFEKFPSKLCDWCEYQSHCTSDI